MIKNIKTAFSMTFKYINLATPLILYFLISGLYILFFTNGNAISLSIAIVLSFLMLSAFLSGWFAMIKSSILKPEKDNMNSISNDFMPGVGEYFLPVSGAILFALILFIISLLVTYGTGIKFIGDVSISVDSFINSLKNTETLKAFLLSLSKEQLIKLNYWNFLILFSNSVFCFVTMFYFPALFFKSKNIFKALIIGLKDLFSYKFLMNTGIFVFVLFTYILISIMTTICSNNIVLHFLFTIINFYYIVFVAVLIGSYYYNNFVKIGSNIDKKV